MRVMHVITGLGLGGAESMLYRMLEASDPAELSQEVVSLKDLGALGEPIQRLGIPTHALGLSRRPSPLKLLRLARLMRTFDPDVVQTWMYHADLIGGVAAKLSSRARIVWGIHNSTLDPTHTRRTTHWTMAACARLSTQVPDAIVSVSRSSRDLHVAAGYAARKFEVIPNGFDLAQFRPDPAQRRQLRSELGLPDDAVVIGLVARVEPQKDHENFVRAAGVLARRHSEARFLLCGTGATWENASLSGALAREGLRDRFLLLGRRNDVCRVMTALDVGTLSSAWGEAFPLAIGEAMACAIPCVVTDLGDCAELVGDTGWVVPPRDPVTLAQAWEACVRLGPEGRRRRGMAARERIAASFSLPRVVERYVSLYRRVTQAPGGTAAPSAAMR
jgi:glycosyltransferase involved in cell wall biosynthesis